MAKSSPDPSEFAVMMVCPKCGEYYDEDIKPRFLRCYHSVCETCLTFTLKTKLEVSCPVCDVVTQTPSPTVDGFPVNHYLINVLPLFKATGRGGGIGVNNAYLNKIMNSIDEWGIGQPRTDVKRAAPGKPEASLSSSLPKNGAFPRPTPQPRKGRLEMDKAEKRGWDDTNNGKDNAAVRRRSVPPNKNRGKNPTSVSDDSSSSDSDSDDDNAATGGPRAVGGGRSASASRKPGWSAEDDEDRAKTRAASSSLSTASSSRVTAGRSGDAAASAGIHPDLATFARPSAMKKTEEDENCPVCQEKLKDPSPYTSFFGSKLSVVRFPCNHVLHHNCAAETIAASGSKKFFKCLSCNASHGVQEGNQPLNGTMKVDYEKAPQKRGNYGFSLRPAFGNSDLCTLPGFPDSLGTFRIDYNFWSGTQGSEHPNPGRPYFARSFPRTAYLPATEKGFEVLCMLKIAFDRRLIFTIGTSATNGSNDTVVWNGIHHKTLRSGGAENHGYPDPKYLDNVTAELAAVGVTPSDITPEIKRSFGFKF